MQLQVELYNNIERKVYWLNVPYEECLKTGDKLLLAEEPGPRPWMVIRTLLGLSDTTELPPKARKGTISRILEGDGQMMDVRAVYPEISVI